MKKLIKRILWLLLAAILIFGVIFAWPRVPIITAYASKNLVSGIFVSERQQEQVEAQELSFFPINLAKNKVDMKNKTVTSSILGLAKRTAVYREGLGGVNVIGRSLEELQAEKLPSLQFPEYRPDTTPWPLGDMLPDTFPARIDIKALDQLVETAFDQDPENPMKTFSLMVVYKDQIIAEEYAPGVDINTRLVGWSMSKSITSALTGMMQKKGLMDPSERPNIPEWASDDRKNILLDHMLHMNTGIAWDENYFNISEATIMLYRVPDMYEYSIQMPAQYAPGEHWYYSSGTTNTLSGLIRKECGSDEEYYRMAYEDLFYPTGMLSAVFETDPSGTFVGSSYCYATTRDWARFGLLYLHDGIFCGDTILPPGWVDYTVQEAAGSEGVYGAMFWLNKSKELPDVPDDMYYCDGFLGQRVFILPSQDLVVVRMGYSSSTVDFNDFLSKLIALLPE
jgi:CubicO group peptidase (beta-lactamase class C family)